MKATLTAGLRPDGSVNLAAFKAHAATRPDSQLPWKMAASVSGFLPRQINSASRTQTFRHCALIACALERHRLTTGKLPASLADLPADLLKKVPVGTTTALPPAYALSPDGAYTLTYAREDFCEDSGNERSVPADIVWSMPAKQD